MLQLAASVSTTDRLLRVEGDLTTISAHSRFRIGNELVDLSGFAKYPLVGGRRRSGLDKTRWVVTRGVGGSTPENHTAGTSIAAAVTASVSGQGPEPPAPFAGGSDGEAGVHTHDDYADAEHTHSAPDLSGYATTSHTHETSEHDHDYEPLGSVATHAATPHGGDAGPHTHDGYVETDDARLTDARTPTAHTHDYADPDHTHAAPDLSGYATASHDHDADYSGLGHAHDTSHTHTASDVGAATTGHTHDLSALATDAEVTAAIAAHVQSQTHGGGAGHTHTVQADPGALSLSGNTNQQIGQLRDAINADRAVLRAAGIIG